MNIIKVKRDAQREPPDVSADAQREPSDVSVDEQCEPPDKCRLSPSALVIMNNVQCFLKIKPI